MQTSVTQPKFNYSFLSASETNLIFDYPSSTKSNIGDILQLSKKFNLELSVIEKEFNSIKNKLNQNQENLTSKFNEILKKLHKQYYYF